MGMPKPSVRIRQTFIDTCHGGLLSSDVHDTSARQACAKNGGVGFLLTRLSTDVPNPSDADLLHCDLLEAHDLEYEIGHCLHVNSVAMIRHYEDDGVFLRRL